MPKRISIEISDKLIKLLGSEDEIARMAKQSLILDLVRKGEISRAKAADLLKINLWDLPAFLSEYGIPYFDYSKKQMEEDMAILRKFSDQD